MSGSCELVALGGENADQAECDARIGNCVAALDVLLSDSEMAQVRAQLRRAWLVWRASSPQAAASWLVVAERVQREFELVAVGGREPRERGGR